MRIGLLGGTFDPPHLAHLHAGEVAYRQLGLDAVWFVPTGAPWQKMGRQVSAASHRWAMIELAVGGVEYFSADDREVHRRGWTYTADTVASIDSAMEIVLVLGADAARNLPTWQRAGEVMDRVDVAVAPRPGTSHQEVEAAIGEAHWLEMAPLDVSGTMLRERVKAGRSVRFLVPEPVWGYIGRHYLYRDDAEVAPR